MRNEISLDLLRTRPTEWRRRGLTPPDELTAIVAARVANTGAGHVRAAGEPSYADFFTAA